MEVTIGPIFNPHLKPVESPVESNPLVTGGSGGLIAHGMIGPNKQSYGSTLAPPNLLNRRRSIVRVGGNGAVQSIAGISAMVKYSSRVQFSNAQSDSWDVDEKDSYG